MGVFCWEFVRIACGALGDALVLGVVWMLYSCGWLW